MVKICPPPPPGFKKLSRDVKNAVTTSSPVQFFDQQLEHIKQELFEADDKFSCYHNRNIPSVESLLGNGRGEGRIRMVRRKVIQYGMFICVSLPLSSSKGWTLWNLLQKNIQGGYQGNMT